MLLSIQSLNQHRSRSTKPQSSRNGISDNSYVNRLQSQRQRSTDNNTRLSTPLSNVKSSGLSDITKISRARKSTTPVKKVTQKKTTTPTGHDKLLGVDQQIKPKTDSELSDVQLKSTMEIVERRSDESPSNFDDEREMYSGITSPESVDLKFGKETISEQLISPMNYSTIPINDETIFQSNISEQMINETKIEQLEMKNSNLSFDNLSSEISKKTELEMTDVINIPDSKWKRLEEVENLISSTDSIPNESDSQEMILSNEEIDDEQCLAKNGMKMENKSKRLSRGQSSTDEREIVQQNQRYQSEEMLDEPLTDELKHVEDKMIAGNFEKTDEIISSPTKMRMLEVEEGTEFPENKQSEIGNTEICVETPELTLSGNNTETTNQEVPLDKTDTEYDVDEFVAINGEILEISPEGKLEGHDSVVISEIYSVDPVKEVPVVTEDSIPVSKDSASFAVSAEKLCAIETVEGVCYTEIEFSDEQEIRNDFTELKKTEYLAEQNTEDCNIERLSKLPELMSTPIRKTSESPELMPMSVLQTSETNNESFELPKSESSFEQLNDSMENEQQISANTGEHLSEKIEIATKNDELESVKDIFQVEQLPEFSIDKHLKYQETTMTTESKIIDENFETKIQQSDDSDVDDLNFNNKHHIDEKSDLSTSVSYVPVNDDDISSIENSHSRIPEEITENMELQQQTKMASHEMEVSGVEATTGIQLEKNGIQEVNDVLQTEKTEASKSTESITQQFMKSLEHDDDDDTVIEKSKTETVLLAKQEIPEMITASVKGELPEAILLNPENLIIDGLTNNYEPVISGMQEVQSFILTPLETMKHESDGQINTLNNLNTTTTTTDTNHLFEKKLSTENLIIDKSGDKINSTEMESDLSESIENSLISNIPRLSNLSSIELNASECSREEIEKNEILADNDDISGEELSSELLARENFDEINNTIKSNFNEGIPKIVVCSDEMIISDVENVEKLMMQADKQQSMIVEKANDEILDKQSGISENEAVINSVRNIVPEEVNETKQSMRGQINEFLEQYMNDIIQNIAELADERIETSSKISNDEVEKVKIQQIDKPDDTMSIPECIPESTTQFSTINFPKSQTDEIVQRSVENSNIASSMLTDQMINSDKNMKISESYDIINISDPYHRDITAKEYMLDEYESNVKHNISLQQMRSYTPEEFPESIKQVEGGYVQELQLENKKLKYEISQTTNELFSNNILPKYCCLINGLTADGQLILNSINESMLTMEKTKFINYIPSNNDSNDKIPLITDKNGNPEMRICDMQHIQIESTNICAADVNANISAMQETFHIKSIKHEQEMEEDNMLTDQHLLLEQSNTGADEHEVINVNRGEHSIS
ncbi:unnamed protein product [Wuchereria bancrofti]|uniref:Uncharacterized protein n=1 Tax=Wuchereria bancrofti TaxID=6293 RepID=A0A3P7DKP2_WUCBA|nr:unnamed protein product [Wuchereria bancrofti]